MKGNIFTQTNMRKPQQNTFDLSHDRKFSCKSGELIPILNMECLPGDKISLQASHLLRFSPMVAPIMHEVNAYIHFFFVPNRIIWDGWEDFITGGEDGEDDTVHPYYESDMDSFDIGKLADYLGLPVQQTSDVVRFNPMPFAAFTKIYNEYYRDQNLQTPVPDKCVDGDNAPTLDTIIFAQCPPRAWNHDYFSSALPWTQKGPEATIPLGTSAPVIQDPDSVAGQVQISDIDFSIWSGGAGNITTDSSGNALAGSTPDAFTIDPDPLNWVADLSTATASSIIDLRNAFALQEWLEKNARGGSRYIESILVHFGVRSSDKRLQRPEFIGGSKTPVRISEVLQTSDDAAGNTPQGNMAGHGVSAGQNNRFNYFCEEHGWLLGIMSIMPKTAYYQGMHRSFFRFDKFDYAFPEFQHIGEQEIFNKEIYVSDDGENDDVFGYIPRYAEYKYIPSSVHGEFRTTLDHWHWARSFATRPALNSDFIQCIPDTRIFAVETGENMYVHVYNDIKATRKLAYFSNPGRI